MKWRNKNTNYAQVAYEAMQKGRRIQAKCCDNPQAHIYLHKYEDGDCAAWVWCSACGSFAHYDGVIGDIVWENCDGVDYEQLAAIPDYLESVKEMVDAHTNRYLRGE